MYAIDDFASGYIACCFATKELTHEIYIKAKMRLKYLSHGPKLWRDFDLLFKVSDLKQWT
jgi:hypothetical protein